MAQCKITLVVENNEEVSITFDSTNYIIDKRLNPAIVSEDGENIYNAYLVQNLYIEEPINKNVLSTFFEDLFLDKKIISINSFKSIEVENLETNKTFSSNGYKISNFGVMYHITSDVHRNSVPNNCIINFTFASQDEVNNG